MALRKKKKDAVPVLETPKKNDAVLHTQHKTPSHDEIARLARKYWAERGYRDGYADQDWLRAEQTIQQQ